MTMDYVSKNYRDLSLESLTKYFLIRISAYNINIDPKYLISALKNSGLDNCMLDLRSKIGPLVNNDEEVINYITALTQDTENYSNGGFGR